MIAELTDLMKKLRLTHAAERLPDHLSRAATGRKTSYTRFLRDLLGDEWADRQHRAAHNRLKRAKLPEDWSLESFPFDRQPGVDARQIRELGELDFLANGTNIVLIGDVGVGKTGLAVGLLRRALTNGFTGLFIKAQDLADQLYASLADRKTPRLIAKLARLQLLVVDELGYLSLEPEHAKLIWRVLDARYRHRPVILTTNLGFDEWPGFLGCPAMAQALIDRLTENCHTIRIEGPSLRTTAR